MSVCVAVVCFLSPSRIGTLCKIAAFGNREQSRGTKPRQRHQGNDRGTRRPSNSYSSTDPKTGTAEKMSEQRMIKRPSTLLFKAPKTGSAEKGGRARKAIDGILSCKMLILSKYEALAHRQSVRRFILRYDPMGLISPPRQTLQKSRPWNINDLIADSL